MDKKISFVGVPAAVAPVRKRGTYFNRGAQQQRVGQGNQNWIVYVADEFSGGTKRSRQEVASHQNFCSAWKAILKRSSTNRAAGNGPSSLQKDEMSSTQIATIRSCAVGQFDAQVISDARGGH